MPMQALSDPSNPVSPVIYLNIGKKFSLRVFLAVTREIGLSRARDKRG
jgi:hypothetical protein